MRVCIGLGFVIVIVLTAIVALLYALLLPILFIWLIVTLLLIFFPNLQFVWNIFAGMILFVPVWLLFGDTVGPGDTAYYRRFWYSFLILNPLLILLAIVCLNVVSAPWGGPVGIVLSILAIIVTTISFIQADAPF